VTSKLPVGLQAGSAQISVLPRLNRVQLSSWQLPLVVSRASSVTKGRAAKASDGMNRVAQASAVSFRERY
jgi:hypothetical protein